MPDSFIGEDLHFVQTNKTLAENAFTFGTKGFLVGALYSFYDLNHNFTSRPFLTNMGVCFGRYAIPVGTSAAVFASTTAMLDEWRGKHKAPTNAAIGGFLAGIVFGARYKNPAKMFNFGLNIGALAFITRLMITLQVRKGEKGELDKIREEVYISQYDDLRSNM